MNSEYGKWFNLGHLGRQENEVREITERRFGLGRGGFCDTALMGVELLFQSLYIKDQNELDEKGNYKDFQSAICFLAFMHYHRVSYTFLSAYNLLVRGYYTESASLLRPIIETFVRLKYVNKNGELEDINKILINFGKPKKDKYAVHISAMFKAISEELYTLYSILCDIAHGGLLAHIQHFDSIVGQMNTALGLEYKEDAAGLIINQYTIYMLSHLLYLPKVFPRIINRMPVAYAEKYNRAISKLTESTSQMAAATNATILTNATMKLNEY